jgi:hypothetical protein
VRRIANKLLYLWENRIGVANLLRGARDEADLWPILLRRTESERSELCKVLNINAQALMCENRTEKRSTELYNRKADPMAFLCIILSVFLGTEA